MGRYSIIVKTEEVRRRVQAGKFDSAMKVVETIPLKKLEILQTSVFLPRYILIIKNMKRPWSF